MQRYCCSSFSWCCCFFSAQEEVRFPLVEFSVVRKWMEIA